MCKRWGAVAVLIGAVAYAQAQPHVAPAIEKMSEGVWLLRGEFLPGRQPDGNTLIFAGKQGLVVFDTGRHAWHRAAILDFAAKQRRPVVAIFNSHWHLDHSSGNADLKRAYPKAKLYTGTAVERMIRDVFPQGVARAQAFLDAGTASPELAEDIRGDIATRQNSKALQAEVPVTSSGTQTIDGLRLEVNLAPNAATDTDVWLYEPRSRLAVVGDLVTLPVPFLDTACTHGWSAALAKVLEKPFETAIPGHGRPMTHPEVLAYQAAYESYVQCAHGTASASDCAHSWLKATAQLRAPEAADDTRATEMAADYVELLRANHGESPRCSLAP